MVVLITGMGHFPLIPITGRASNPSGFAVTQVMLKSYMCVFAETTCPQNHNAKKTKRLHAERAMLAVLTCPRTANTIRYQRRGMG